MTIPRKSSRKIVVDGVAYRWKPSLYQGYPRNMCTGMVVQLDVKPVNSVLQIHWGYDWDPIVTPVMVEKAIRTSLAMGWDPKGKGPFRGSMGT